MRDFITVSYALRSSAIKEKRAFLNASNNNFNVGTFDEMIPNADLVINLLQTSNIQCYKRNTFDENRSALSYSHGFNIEKREYKLEKT